MVPVSKTTLAKEFFYIEPKKESFKNGTAFAARFQYCTTFFAPVNRTRLFINSLHYNRGINRIQTYNKCLNPQCS
jgi:hypothetical protein